MHRFLYWNVFHENVSPLCFPTAPAASGGLLLLLRPPPLEGSTSTRQPQRLQQMVAQTDRLPTTNEKLTAHEGGAYKLGRQLGDGGYGVVFVCQHLNKSVLLPLPSPSSKGSTL